MKKIIIILSSLLLIGTAYIGYQLYSKQTKEETEEIEGTEQGKKGNIKTDYGTVKDVTYNYDEQKYYLVTETWAIAISDGRYIQKLLTDLNSIYVGEKIEIHYIDTVSVVDWEVLENTEEEQEGLEEEKEVEQAQEAIEEKEEKEIEEDQGKLKEDIKQSEDEPSIEDQLVEKARGYFDSIGGDSSRLSLYPPTWESELYDKSYFVMNFSDGNRVTTLLGDKDGNIYTETGEISPDGKMEVRLVY